MFIGKQDAINEGIGALRGGDGFRQSLFAAVVNAIGEYDEGLAAWLLFQQFVGGQENGVVEQCAAPAAAVGTTPTASAARGATTATRGATLRELRRSNLINGRLEFLAGRGEVLKKRNLTVKLNDKGFVLVHAQNLIEKCAAGGALLIQEAPLAHAGVHQQSKRKGEIGFLCEISDGLGLAILFQGEIVLGQIADDVPMLIAHGGEQVDGVDVERDGRALLAMRRQIDQEKRHAEEQKAQLGPLSLILPCANRSGS